MKVPHLNWLMSNGFPQDPKNNNQIKDINNLLMSKVRDAVSFKIKYHTDWQVMSDLINSDINKHLKLPSFYHLMVLNKMYEQFETHASALNFDELPVDIESTMGENKSIVSIYASMIKAEDRNIDGEKIRRDIYTQALKKQIAWAHFYVDTSKTFESFGTTWRNQIKVETVDATKIHFDPNTSKMDLSDCEYLVMEEYVSYSELKEEFGEDKIDSLEITPNGNDGEQSSLSENNSNTSNTRQDKKVVWRFYFRDLENGKFVFYSANIVDNKLIDTPKKLVVQAYPFVAYTKIKVHDDQLIGTNELFLTKQDYVTSVKVGTALATNAIYESGQQKMVNAQNIDFEHVKKLIGNPFAIIPVQNTNDVRNQVVSLEKREAPNSAYQIPGMADASIDKVSGNTNAMQGNTGSIQSGQGINAALAAGTQRQNFKTQSLKDFFVEYTKMLTAFMVEYYDIPKVSTIPKNQAGNSVIDLVEMSTQEVDTNSKDKDPNSETKILLKKYGIKFKEDEDNIYVIAKMEDLNKLSTKITINMSKFSRMNEQELSRSIETLYALDSQDPTGTRVMTKEMFVKLHPGLRGVRDEILEDYKIREAKTEKNKVAFISKATAAMVLSMQNKGIPQEAIPIDQITAQVTQMWFTLPENIRADGTVPESSYVSSKKSNISAGGKDNKSR